MIHVVKRVEEVEFTDNERVEYYSWNKMFSSWQKCVEEN